MRFARWQEERHITVAKVQRLLQRRAPPGSPAKAVNAFLASDPWRVGGRWSYEPYAWRDGMAGGWIKATEAGLGTQVDIEIRFFFDMKQRLVRTRVREVPFGL